MTLKERIEEFDKLFDDLINVSGRNDKEYFIDEFLSTHPELENDFYYILETLVGKHPIGWTYLPSESNEKEVVEKTIRECIEKCINVEPKTSMNEVKCEVYFGNTIGSFLEPIVNRTLKLGINKSLLSNDFAPMLAKKYEGQPISNITITEKLDGNRCIAYYRDDKWHFIARSGKVMRVSFDMSNFPKYYVYDGEVMSREQTELSIKRNNNVLFEVTNSNEMFNKTSGLINRKGIDKDLVYNIFDIQIDLPYISRRKILSLLKDTNNVRILPILNCSLDLNELLDKIVSSGGEGIMLNDNKALYQHRRTNALLKYKKVQTIDMRVIGIEEGTSKYENMVGSLICFIKTDDGRDIICKVGSGLSDEERYYWYLHSENIIDKIVEVAYFEITDNSLRFPRLKCVRKDKDYTSEY